VDASQLGPGQGEVKTEDNAPINVKVCVCFREVVASSMLTVPRTHAHAGRQLDRGRSLFQNQAEYKVEQVARRLCGQGGQGRVEHPVRVSLSAAHAPPSFGERDADTRSRTGSCTTGLG
jgi:hypothetical protein